MCRYSDCEMETDSLFALQLDMLQEENESILEKVIKVFSCLVFIYLPIVAAFVLRFEFV